MELNLSMYLTNAISFENVYPSFPFPIIDQHENGVSFIDKSKVTNEKKKNRDTGLLANACVISLIKSICFVESFEISRKRILRNLVKENGRLG